jgi:ESCRT-I complex subunit TSG101
LIKHLTNQIQVDLNKFYPKTRDKFDELTDIQGKLSSGSERLKAGLAGLERQKAQLMQGLQAVEQKNREIDAWMQSNQSTSESVPVDEIIQPANSFSNQMYSLSAKSSAIEDTMYHLEKALQNGTIELDVFLKVS